MSLVSKEQKIPFPYSQCDIGTLQSFEKCVRDSKEGKCNKNMTSNPNEPCCNFWTTFLGHDLKPIMRVMRMASGRGIINFIFIIGLYIFFQLHTCKLDNN